MIVAIEISVASVPENSRRPSLFTDLRDSKRETGASTSNEWSVAKPFPLSLVSPYELASAFRERACRDLTHFYAFPTRMLIGSARFKAYSALSAKTRIAREHCMRFFIASAVRMRCAIGAMKNRIVEKAAPDSVDSTAERLMNTH